MIIAISHTSVTVINYGSRYSSIGFGLPTGVRFPTGAEFVSCPACQDRLWGPSNFLSSGHREICFRG